MLKTKLLQHQIGAVEKLKRLKVGALYMEQGTGKTRTALELVWRRLEVRKVNKVLWLTPCSVKSNLKEEIEKHSDMLRYIRIEGIESLSASGRLYAELYEKYVNKDCFIIVDESNLVKNINAKRTKRIIELAQKCQYKLILNGTPITKNEGDLFAQWYILDWRILGYRSFYSFAANHLEYKKITLPNGKTREDKKRVIRVLNVDYLTEKIAPYSYQVKKEACLQLPKKQYVEKTYYLSKRQRVLYSDIKRKYLAEVDEIRSSTIYKLFTALQHVVSGRKVMTLPSERMRTEDLFNVLEDNPRIRAFIEVINKIGDEQAIIFVKYKIEVQEISSILKDMGKTCVIYTGEVTSKGRELNRLLFKRSDVQFFISNKSCGSYGLNLQFCKNIIYYDNDFDYGSRAQSEDRIHRLGQDKNIMIYDIVAEGTIDEFIQRCLLRKEKLLHAFQKEVERRKGVYMNGVKYYLASADGDINFYNLIGPALGNRQVRKELGGYPINLEEHWPCIFAEKDEELLGFIVLQPFRDHYDIQSGFVYPEYRNRGIATKLLKYAIEFCEEENMGISATIPENARDLFAKFEFIEISRRGKWVKGLKSE